MRCLEIRGPRKVKALQGRIGPAIATMQQEYQTAILLSMTGGMVSRLGGAR